ncbi:MAG: carbamoyl-phosphate synthase small subunit [Acidiferrobacteraceae bacterium]|nr:carbamoyl-phosphate synthase small subunit [Acidiferrobacteraceae bacterium]MDP6122760.1 glutamine-hydrolyzing carbamoyl-phosphate synthase small subunit [Arenicellales bacterium]MDP6435102.1 glutamine-hydrolyzing carbamoyl-phosphate synthase small subunit [Arenicellales bacterium]MDP6672155.1 glutamine-hydrolyzing carbamoyl-phosphate synthase small subunit [Arenicellales bacterium]MDP6724504.1 glutamine-hydrolyzing carbamoyl-phosphate synthase small subunit [Arenicellales bacterium]
MKQALLVLEDGTLFQGRSAGVSGYGVGEVVFNTSMTGYQEILTDPSYARQLVTLTYSHIGNTGTTEEDEEAGEIYASGLIIRDLPPRVSNWRSTQSLPDYLSQRRIVAISDIDTRKLTRHLRQKGAQNGCIAAGETIDEDEALEKARDFPGLKGMDLAQEVTVSRPYRWSEGSWRLGEGHRPGKGDRFHVVAFDFGVKRNILRMLADRGCGITVVPATTTAQEVMGMNPDGVFLSNGPGDPEPCDYAVAAIKELLRHQVPLFGICLGHQLLCLAAGGKTKKMKFGHHGANHPVQERESKQVLITSQNHGFAVDDADLPSTMRVTHRSLFDNSVQGIELNDAPAFSFQGHPEASPGPHDISALFDRFIEQMSVEASRNKE